MSLGNLLLHPQRLQRTPADPQVAVVQDVLRLMTLLAEDAAEDGPLAQAALDTLEGLGQRLQPQIEDGIDGVFDAIKTRLRPLFLYLESLQTQLDGVDRDPTALLALIRQIVQTIKDLLGQASQQAIQAELDFALGLLQNQLGMNQTFVAEQIGQLLTDITQAWRQLPADLPATRRRRKNLAIHLTQGLRRRLLEGFALPEIDTTRAAAGLYRQLRRADISRIIEQVLCSLDRFDQALAAAQDLGDALPIQAPAGASAGAALVDLPGATRYSWYASWLLSNEDLPLLAISDIKHKKRFVDLFRFHQGETLKADTVSRFFYSQLALEDQRALLDYDGNGEPDEGLLRRLVAHVNQFMMQGPIYTEARFSTPDANQLPLEPPSAPFDFRLLQVEVMQLPEDLEELRRDYPRSQQLIHFNRRFLEWVYGGLISHLHHAFWRYLDRETLGIQRDVLVSGDKRYVMCDDIPIYIAPPGQEARWQDSLLFVEEDSDTPAEGATYYQFLRISSDTCEILAQVFEGILQTIRPIWHLADLQPGQEIGTGVVAGLDIAHALNELLFFKPISGYEGLGGWGKFLNNDLYGPRGLALAAFSLQGRHTDTTFKNKFAFFVTVLLGNFIRVGGHNTPPLLGRSLLLTIFTLLNSSHSNSGDSSLPANPAANHRKQAGIIMPINDLFTYILVQHYRLEDHSIKIWSAKDIGEQRSRAFGLWFGGSIGYGLLSGLAGSVLAQGLAWKEDFKLLFIAMGESMAHLFLFYWLFEYFFKEGDTDDGAFARIGAYKGYPSQASSPYRLPFAAGTALYMGQGNNGLFSHNTLSSGTNWQGYAFDFGHNHGQEVRAMRAGVVWDFKEDIDDNDSSAANFIIIRHATQIADHDDPRNSGTPAFTFARYLHGARDGVTAAFGAAPSTERNNPGMGTAVAQGDLIMLADDTGTSFHNHVHIDVYTGTATSRGNESIPFVFADVSGDGRPKSLTWYRAGG